MNLSRFSLEGKIALVTGGSRGIGKASALALADAGAHVAVSSRKIADLEPVAEEIRGRGVRGMAVAAHNAKLEDSKALVEKVTKELGGIDILVNNAGTNPYYGPIMDLDERAWDVTMNVNLKGLFFLSQICARHMKARGGGCIINVSSIGGLRPSELGVYSVSKAGVIMLTEVTAKEWGQHNIRVNAIAPGIIKTRLSEALWKEPGAGKKAVGSVPLMRLGEPEEIAGAVVFLASNAAGYMNGATVVIDGGRMYGEPSHLEKK
jgi:dehydrogenase/reductase SDR family protein 4